MPLVACADPAASSAQSGVSAKNFFEGVMVVSGFLVVNEGRGYGE
jgi:hypothetical protein